MMPDSKMHHLVNMMSMSTRIQHLGLMASKDNQAENALSVAQTGSPQQDGGWGQRYSVGARMALLQNDVACESVQ